VYFEKENIFTLDSKGELLITIMSSLAQEESRSISENVTWGMRKRFAEGKPIIPYGAFLGYRKGPDGIPEIDPEQAETVRYIYRAFPEGKAPSYIARDLTARWILTPGGKTTWRANTVMSILTNVTIADLIQDNGRRMQKAPEIRRFPSVGVHPERCTKDRNV